MRRYCGVWQIPNNTLFLTIFILITLLLLPANYLRYLVSDSNEDYLLICAGRTVGSSRCESRLIFRSSFTNSKIFARNKSLE